jgi:tRNA pseudouridine38-40 synthase
MARYKVILAYDGTAFSGMQRQANSRSVQAEVEKALRKLGWRQASITAAGRTDAGVHASEQVVAFDLDWRHKPADLLNALNAELPREMAAKKVSVAKAEFHPRFDAKKRTYEYRLFCQPQRDPLRERYAWRVWPAVRLTSLQAASRQLLGERDFAAFGTPPKKGAGTVRKIYGARWRKAAKDEFVFEVTANAFLYHMVRHMVGLQVAVAQSGAKNRIKKTLDGKSKVRELAPAHGLTLVSVEY